MLFYQFYHLNYIRCHVNFPFTQTFFDQFADWNDSILGEFEYAGIILLNLNLGEVVVYVVAVVLVTRVVVIGVKRVNGSAKHNDLGK